jgi:hypothetical protein
MSEEQPKPNRYPQWFSVAAFSVIALVGLTSTLKGDLSNQAKQIKWSASAMSVALTLSALAVFAHIAKDRFIGTPIEGGLVS